MLAATDNQELKCITESPGRVGVNRLCYLYNSAAVIFDTHQFYVYPFYVYVPSATYNWLLWIVLMWF